MQMVENTRLHSDCISSRIDECDSVTRFRVCFRSDRHASERRRRRRDRGYRSSRLSTTDARPPWSRRSRGPGAVAAIKAVGLLPPLGRQHPAALLGQLRAGPANTRRDGQFAERQQEEAEEAGDCGGAGVHVRRGARDRRGSEKG